MSLNVGAGKFEPRLTGGVIVAALIAAAVVAQALISPTSENIFSALIAGVITGAVWGYCLDADRLRRFPLSTLALLGLNFVTAAEALFFQSLWGRAITFNLQSSLETFTAIAVYTGICLLVHAVYARTAILQQGADAIARRAWKAIWLFDPPTDFQLWIVGIVGLAATAISRSVSPDAVEYGDVGGKFLQSLYPLINAPVLILLRRWVYPVAPPVRPGTIALLGGYFLVVIAVSIVANARVFFASILLLGALGLFLGLTHRRVVLGGKGALLLLLGAVVALPGVLLAQDLATAMVIAREARSTQNVDYLVRETLTAFQDKELLQRKRSSTNEVLSGYGQRGYAESYFESELLQRLSMTKYTDLTITASAGLGADERREIARLSTLKIIAILPTPVLIFAGLDVDKQELEFSSGDLYERSATGAFLRGYRTGSSITLFPDMFGPIWPVVLAVLALACYVMADSLTLRVAGGGRFLSLLGFLFLPNIFQSWLVNDSIATIVGALTRGLATTALLLAAIMYIARWWSSAFEFRQ